MSPQIDVLPVSSGAAGPAFARGMPVRGHGLRRLYLFAGVFLACLVAGLVHVWSRTPVYQSSASLRTAADGGTKDTDRQVRVSVGGMLTVGSAAAEAPGVTIQQQVLLGMPLMEDILRRLRAGPGMGQELTLGALQAMVSLEPAAGTDVVKLRARGTEPAPLAVVANTWVDAYLALREQGAQQHQTAAVDTLAAETERLGRQIAAKRLELERFRMEHNILSHTDIENQAMARLSGLNKALNTASDAEVAAKARLEAIRAALARGEPVLPRTEQTSLADLERRAQQLREQVQELQRHYTARYIAMRSQLKVVPEHLARVEEEIRRKRELGKAAMVSEADQAYASADASVAEIRRQIEEHKREASEFTTRFAEQEAMQADIARLEEIERDTQARRAQLVARDSADYPPVEVLERAYPPTRPLWPDYWRDSGIALAASLVAALLAVLLHDFLIRREPVPVLTPLPDIRVFSVPERLFLNAGAEVLPELAREPLPPSLENPLPRELSDHEVRLLLEAADAQARQMAGLLLSGLNLHEAASLREEDFDFPGNRILVGGEAPRILPLAPALKNSLAEIAPVPAWANPAEPPDPEDLAARVRCAAVDAGLTEAGTVDAGTLRHTYIAHLVRLGIRLAELERVVGPLPARLLAGYGRYAPPGPKLRVESVPLVHPALRHDDRPGPEAA